MKKTLLLPPEAWPPEAHSLYQDFEARLSQRMMSARSYLRFLYHFFRYQQKRGLSFREFPEAHLDAYLKPMTARNRQQLLPALSAWLRFLYLRKELLLPLHEELARRRVRTQSRRVLLSHQQVLQLLELPDPDQPEGLRDRAFLEMAYATGMRRGELVALDLTDLDLALGLVRIRQTKNGWERTVPLTIWALHFLQRYLGEARPQLASPLSLNALWLGKAGRRLYLNQLGIRLRHVYKIKKTLGFSVTLHQLRHACATHLLTSGAGLRQIQELLGHLALNSTQTYTHITPACLREVHQRCHPRNNGAIHLAEEA